MFDGVRCDTAEEMRSRVTSVFSDLIERSAEDLKFLDHVYQSTIR